ncbi:MAG: hypothetical protein ACK5Q5_11770 [Planctomycetaceae bacterium]
MFRIIGLMACSGLVAGSLWLPDQALAQNASPFPATSPTTFRESPDVARQRVNDFLAKAEKAWRGGDSAEATRLALAADRLARDFNIQFGYNEPSPGALLAQMQGISTPPPPTISASAAPAASALPVITPQALPSTAVTAPPQMAAGTPSDHHRHVQNLLRAAEADLRAGRGSEAMDKARRAEQYAAQNQVQFGVVDLRPEHVMSLCRRQFPEAMTSPGAIQQVAHSDADIAAPSTVKAAPQVTIPSDPAAAKQTVKEILAAARQKMDQGYFDEARSLALQAKQFDNVVEYSVFDDRPEHVLTEIERQTRTTIMVASQPQAGGQADPRREQALSLMRDAQQALVEGQLDSAEQLASQAQQLGATLTLADPRPEVLLQDIATYRANMGLTPASRVQQTAAVSPAPAASAEDAKAQATALLQAARSAMQNGQMAEAQSYAQQASQFDVTYGLLEDRPDRLLADIARLSQGGIQQVAGTMTPAASNTPAVSDPSLAAEKQLATQLLGQARAALQQGDVDAARHFAMQADQLEVAYDLLEDRPDTLLADIERSAGQGSVAGMVPNRQPQSPVRDSFVAPSGASAQELFQMGTAALRQGDRETAREAFLAAHHSGQPLDAVMKQKLQDYLTELQPTNAIRQASNEVVTDSATGERSTEILSAATQRREIRADRLQTQVLEAVYRAEKLRDKEPDKALDLLTKTSSEINAAQISDQEKARLLASVESTAASIEAYMEQRRPMIELERRNSAVRDQIQTERAAKHRVEQELAKLVDDYNTMMEQRRYAEAHHLARQARELDPTNPVVVQMFYQSQFAGRNDSNNKLRENKENSFWTQLNDVEEAVIVKVTDEHPMVHPDNWDDIIKRRKGTPTDLREHSEEEMRVREALDKPVSLHFQDEPLAAVLEHINATQLINVVADEAGLMDSGVQASTPITINVDGIKLKSALNLILVPLDLSYTIEDEVLKITSRLRQQGDLEAQVYPVADLVVPVTVDTPASVFQPGSGFGQLQNGGQLPSSSGMPNMGVGFGQVADPLNAGFPTVNGSPSGTPQQSDRLANYDFQSLMQLITQTIEPESWDEFGGQATIAEHGGTLSLVIRQTQRVHQEIADLLEQLRRLQDLQVTIEVRFITVSDSFFERIGIDFDFNIQDSVGGPTVNNDFTPLPAFGSTDTNFGNTGTTSTSGTTGGTTGTTGTAGATSNAPFGAAPGLNVQSRDSWPSRTVIGMLGENQFSNDLDLPFRQGSFAFGVPQFGGFTESANVGMTFGMAILSDIEAFLFVNAAQGDTRSNVMFAPKITLFNGQIGMVQDNVQRPFVTSLTPTVGVGAVGFTPQITIIPDGVTMMVRAVISADRRYVRLSVSPNFTSIVDVQTFTFASGNFAGGTGVNIAGGAGGNTGGVGGAAGGTTGTTGTTSAGATTVQQPIFNLLNVTTVVSVPDGGTVLLGGVKRLREGRSMAGVPILNKIPYVSRLFKNTGVGRETESAMLMVTPRIIIAEEEEELLGIPSI